MNGRVGGRPYAGVMHVRGLIQSSVTQEITAEADDAETARAAIEDQVADGYELIRVRHSMPRGGRVIATGTVRLTEVRDLDSMGSNYGEARDALRAAVPEGWRLLSIQVVEA